AGVERDGLIIRIERQAHGNTRAVRPAFGRQAATRPDVVRGPGDLIGGPRQTRLWSGRGLWRCGLCRRPKHCDTQYGSDQTRTPHGRLLLWTDDTTNVRPSK